jgi:hypothetical protein
MALRGDGWTATTPTMPPMNSAAITIQQKMTRVSIMEV